MSHITVIIHISWWLSSAIALHFVWHRDAFRQTFQCISSDIEMLSIKRCSPFRQVLWCFSSGTTLKFHQSSRWHRDIFRQTLWFFSSGIALQFFSPCIAVHFDRNRNTFFLRHCRMPVRTLQCFCVRYCSAFRQTCVAVHFLCTARHDPISGISVFSLGNISPVPSLGCISGFPPSCSLYDVSQFYRVWKDRAQFPLTEKILKKNSPRDIRGGSWSIPLSAVALTVLTKIDSDGDSIRQLRSVYNASAAFHSRVFTSASISYKFRPDFLEQHRFWGSGGGFGLTDVYQRRPPLMPDCTWKVFSNSPPLYEYPI